MRQGYILKTNSTTVKYQTRVTNKNLAPAYITKSIYYILDKTIVHNKDYRVGTTTISFRRFYIRVNNIDGDRIDFSLEVFINMDVDTSYEEDRDYKFSYEDLEIISEILREFIRDSDLVTISSLERFNIDYINRID